MKASPATIFFPDAATPPLLPAKQEKMPGQIRRLQVVRNKLRIKVTRQKVAGIVNYVGQGFVNIDDVKADPATAKSPDTRNLDFRLNRFPELPFSQHVKTQDLRLQV